MRFRSALCLLVLAALPAHAVIMKLTPLAEVIESEQFILVAAVEKTDPQKPSAVFTVEKALKGKTPFERMPVNMTGDDEAKKENDTKIVLDRLDSTRSDAPLQKAPDALYVDSTGLTTEAVVERLLACVRSGAQALPRETR